MQLAKWKCHKVVSAGKIIQRDGYKLLVQQEDFSHVWVDVDVPFYSRGVPNTGAYYVVYEDGYTSWSPAKAFEEGYSRA